MTELSIVDDFGRGSVQFSAEFARVDQLPRRRWDWGDAVALAQHLTQVLKTPHGTMSLKPHQAVGLYEAWRYQGLFCSLGVGSGKTLLSLLLPVVLNSRSSALLIPAKLKREKTEREFQELRQHWKVPVAPELVSFEALGPVTGKGLLEKLDVDHLGLDEAHKARNPKASRTRKIKHFLKSKPDCRVTVMSGTTIKREIADYAHLIRWSLKGLAPVPYRPDVLEEWDQALSSKIVNELGRLQPGSLLKWATKEDIEKYGLLNAARRGYQRRLEETPGVICYHVDASDIGADIELTGVNIPSSPSIEGAFEILRKKWELPNGQQLVEGCEVYAHARTLPLGFYLVWKYPAPAEWMLKRKAYGQFIRDKLSTHRHFDSPDEVARAYADDPVVQEWRAIRGSFKPETTIVWIDGTFLKMAADWLREPEGGVMFVETPAFGEAVAALARVPYFGAGGLDQSGNSIENYYGRSCVVSVNANGEGRNMQRWNRMFVIPPLEGGDQWEQVIGREHRPGQDCVVVKVFTCIGCKEHLLPFWQSVRDAEMHLHLDGADPKLLLAELDIMCENDMPLPGSDERPRNYAWGKE